jgi:protoheme IX farnesyltransferase
MTAVAGFLLAANGHIDFPLLIETLLGISLIIGSACVINNYIDRNVDELMNRTKERALVTGQISFKNALIFGACIGVIGFIILILWVNSLVVSIGVVAFVDYVILYGISKRRSVHGTLVGSISGAAPILAGYCAVIDRINTEAVILFFILVLWQMPHFYSIALYRYKDYKAAKIPVLPVKKNIANTKIQILIYIVLFSIATVLLRLFGHVGNIYLIVMLLVDLGWLFMSYKSFKIPDYKAWSRKLFFYSLIVILVFSALIALNPWLT